MKDLELLGLVLDRLDATNGKLDEIREVQASQAQILKEHIRRTELNEEAVEVIAKEIKPIQIHVAQVKSIMTAGIWLVGACGGLAGIIKLFSYL